MMAKDTTKRKPRSHPDLIALAMRGGDSPGKGLVFRPEPPGDQGRLDMPIVEINVEVENSELEMLFDGLGGEPLPPMKCRQSWKKQNLNTMSSARRS